MTRSRTLNTKASRSKPRICCGKPGIGVSSRRIYRTSLTTWAWLAAGTQAPVGSGRRSAEAPELALAALDRSDAPDGLAKAFAGRAELVDADTLNRELSVLKAAVTWWRGRGWISSNPIAGIERCPSPPDRTRSLTRDQIAGLFALKADPRERTL